MRRRIELAGCAPADLVLAIAVHGQCDCLAARVATSTEAHAMLGDPAACEQELAAADTTLTRVDDMDAAFELYSVAPPSSCSRCACKRGRSGRRPGRNGCRSPS